MKKSSPHFSGRRGSCGSRCIHGARQQAGYTKVLTAKVVREDLSTVVSGTGQIKPKNYVNVGATAMGRVTHLYVKEGDKVTKGEVVATIENVQQEATVAGQQAAIAAAKTDIASYVAAEKTAQANVEHAQADLEQKKLDWQRAQALYKDGIMAKQDFDAKKAAYDLDVASVAQAVAGLNQAKANTDSARGHMETQVATLQANQDLLNRTIAVAPFDGIVTNEPVREGETVVEGIQNTEGSTLMTLADMSIVTAEVKVDETDIVNVQLGQPAEVTVDALPNKVFKGYVTLVGDQALLRSTGVATSQSTTGTEEAKDFKVVVTLDDPSKELRPGLSCTAKITTAHKTDVLALPIQALTMHDPALESPRARALYRQRPTLRIRNRIPCRVSLLSRRTPMAGCAPNLFPSRPASPAPPTSKCSRAWAPARKLSPAPTRLCATLRAECCSSATRRSQFRCPQVDTHDGG